ncbi:hypothetical protein HPB49_025803 [Dermacentor silvarum]|nr:hypothetical protein HPB49_025803 [Dermacentor silvarum]
MLLVNWSEATPADLAGFTVDYLREELARRNLDATGSKEEIISRLIADIAQTAKRSILCLPQTPPRPPRVATLRRSRQASMQPKLRVAEGLLQQLLHVSQRAAAPVQVTTLPDLPHRFLHT